MGLKKGTKYWVKFRGKATKATYKGLVGFEMESGIILEEGEFDLIGMPVETKKVGPNSMSKKYAEWKATTKRTGRHVKKGDLQWLTGKELVKSLSDEDGNITGSCNYELLMGNGDSRNITHLNRDSNKQYMEPYSIPKSDNKPTSYN